VMRAGRVLKRSRREQNFHGLILKKKTSAAIAEVN
jgi:hypothetical protein